MSIQIQLDKPHSCFTNLDNITGKVSLNLFREEAFSAIIVKLEGESRTRLAAPYVVSQNPRRDRRERNLTELEVHKLLYKVNAVFPSLELQHATPNASWTLPAGHHQFPFQFKIPFNNACSASNSMLTNLNVSGVRMEIARDTNRHLKRPLPPSLTGFPGEAEIRYYVKATAQRPAFYKENYRKSTDFMFFPIEPLRQPPNKRESFARKKPQVFPPDMAFQRSSLGGKRNSTSGSAPRPEVSMEGRLPDPAILTCNEPLPLRIIVKKLNKSPEKIFLNLIQIELVGFTDIRAHQLQRQETSSWVLVTMANLRILLSKSNTGAEEDMELDAGMWNRVPLPNTLPPSFQTCNLSRHYVLRVRTGLVAGSPDNFKSGLLDQDIKMPVQVYSGIAPPPALRAEMAKLGGTIQPAHTSPSPVNISSPLYTPPAPQPNSGYPFPGPSGSTHVPPPGEGMDEPPPPSYEDVMADDLAPVDGPRRDYHQPDAPPLVSDEKGGGLRERLFS